MVLVDLESLREPDMSMVKSQGVYHPRLDQYVLQQQRARLSANRFVWWQCVLLAYCWLVEKDPADASDLSSIDNLARSLSDENAPQDNDFRGKFPENDWKRLTSVAQKGFLLAGLQSEQTGVEQSEEQAGIEQSEGQAGVKQSEEQAGIEAINEVLAIVDRALLSQFDHDLQE